MTRKLMLALLIVAALAVVGSLFFRNARRYRLALTSCFENVQGLRTGARVRVAGVEVGRVAGVRARPERKDCPAEVQMDLTTDYELTIPSDGVAEIASEGLLGAKYVEINTQNAKGARAANHATLNGMVNVSPEVSLRGFADQTLRAVGTHGGVVVPASVVKLVRPILDEKQRLASGEVHDENQLNHPLSRITKEHSSDADEALVVLMWFDLGNSLKGEDPVIARGRSMPPLSAEVRGPSPCDSGADLPGDDDPGSAIQNRRFRSRDSDNQSRPEGAGGQPQGLT